MALSAREQLGLISLNDLYDYTNRTTNATSTNPTVGSIWCSCEMNDGGSKMFNRSRLMFIDAYDTWSEALDDKSTKKYKEASSIYD